MEAFRWWYRVSRGAFLEGVGQSWNHRDPTTTCRTQVWPCICPVLSVTISKQVLIVPKMGGANNTWSQKLSFFQVRTFLFTFRIKFMVWALCSGCTNPNFSGWSFFLLCSVLAEDAAPEVHPFLFILLFLHLLPSSELVLFVYMTPMLLAARDGVPFLKCMVFSPNICTWERQSWTYHSVAFLVNPINFFSVNEVQ